MISCLVDTNTLIYWSYDGSPFHDDAQRFVRAAIINNIKLYVLSSSLNDIYYALHRHYENESAAREAIADVASIFDLVSLTPELVIASIASDEPDYEDGLIRAAAELLEVDAIVSYDKKAFKFSIIPRLDAAQALLRMS